MQGISKIGRIIKHTAVLRKVELSAMLANIYLDQLDRYVREYIQRFDKGKERADNPERIKFEYGKRLAVLKLEKVNDKEQRKSIVKEIKAYDKGRAAISCGVDMDENFRRLKYVRYADDFLCAVIGTKAEAETINKTSKCSCKKSSPLSFRKRKLLSRTEENRQSFSDMKSL